MSTAQLALIGDLKGKSTVPANAASYWDSNGVLQSLIAGTDGQVYTTHGIGSPPTFEDAAAGSGGGGGSTIVGGAGMIGSAAFSATGGVVGSLVKTGIVGTVTRLSAGCYQIAFTNPQPDANYHAYIGSSDDSTAAMFTYYSGGASDYTVNGFTFYTYGSGPGPRDPQVVRVVVLRHADPITIGIVNAGSSFYDAEAAPLDQQSPTYELDFKSISAFPSGWTALPGGDFVTHDINVTRPGALWARSTAAEFQFRGKQHASLIPAGTDFCIIWRPWIVGYSENYALATVSLGTTSAVDGNGVFCWTGRHGGYGGGNTFSFERFGSSTGSGGAWNLDRGSTPSAGFMGIRRIGSDFFTGVSPDGSSWQWNAMSHAGMGANALYVGLSLYGSQGVASEGGFSVFRMWVGSGMGVARRSGALRSMTAANIGFEATGSRVALTQADFAWYNQLSADETVNPLDGSIHYKLPARADHAWSARMEDAPATPWTIIARIEPLMFAANYMVFGLCFGNGGTAAADITCLYCGYVDGWIELYAVTGAFGASHFGPLRMRTMPKWFGIRDDGTNWKFYVGMDRYRMYEYWTMARSYAPTKRGYFASCRASSLPVHLAIYSYEKTTTAPNT